jgi:hypothetical protein
MHRDRKILIAILVAFVTAIAIRALYALWSVTDFWGDAYHHWLISRLTLANHGVYTDYKGLETVWLPGYHYLIAVVMGFSGQFDLAPAHLANVLMGSLACGLGAWWVTDITHDWRVGLSAGITLALLPWHIAYSHMNMPEVMAGLMLILVLMAARRPSSGRLLLLAFASALTRHELTLLLVAIGVWLAWRQERRATASLALGTALGLALWSGWSMHVTGDPLMWWHHYRALTAWDAQFWTEAGVRVADWATLHRAAQRAYPPLSLIIFVTIAAAIHPRWRQRVPREGWLLVLLVSFHWLAVGLGFVGGNLPTANPRYVLVSLPILSGAGVVLIGTAPWRSARLAGATLYTILLLLGLFSQLPDFRDMAYVLAPERAAGEHLGAIAPREGNFWVDAPVSIYFSRLEPERFFSSDRLLPTVVRTPDRAPAAALQAMLDHNIDIVLWEDVSYTFVQHAWPQMANERPFQHYGYWFEPIFRYEGWEIDYGARPTLLWQIRPTQ